MTFAKKVSLLVIIMLTLGGVAMSAEEAAKSESAQPQAASSAALPTPVTAPAPEPQPAPVPAPAAAPAPVAAPAPAPAPAAAPVIRASAPQTADSVKVAVIDLKRCLMDSIKGKRLKDEFEAKVEKHDVRYKQIEKEMKDIATELERQSVLLTESGKREKQERFLALREELKNIDRQKKTINDELTMIVVNDVQSIVKFLADNRGYQVVLNDGGPWLIYTAKSADITEEVIKIYDQANSK